MMSRIQNWFDSHPFAKGALTLLWAVLSIAAIALALLMSITPLFYGGIASLIACVFRPGSALHKPTMEKWNFGKLLICLLVLVVTVLTCIIPMGYLSLWNGEIPGHRNQYELMAEAILDGRVNLVYGDEDALAQLENPYDPAEREEAGVPFHWDHAYYNGQYFMYFGVVPVLLVFLPYRVLTGTALTTYHATQLFAALVIVGIFTLFYLLTKLFFKKLPFSVYLALSVAFSVVSIWFSIAEAALYCTAITAALALMVWSLYFFVKAVWDEKRENVQLIYAAIGAIFGALTFGCRPPIALANLLVLPMLVVFLKQRKFSIKLLGKLVLVALPYVLVAAGLMYYNYIRFDDPFEFGQAYQLTVADQHLYKITLNAETIVRVINESAHNFFGIGNLTETFPYLRTCSIFFNFPIFFLCFAIFKKDIGDQMKKKTILPFAIGLIATAVIITAIDIMWTPFLLERYRMDIYFLMGIACFLVIGFWYSTSSTSKHKTFASLTVLAAVLTIVSVFLLYVRTVGAYYPHVMGGFEEMLSLKP